STRGVRACIRRVAGCATPTGSAGHAGATDNLKLTFHPDHSAGAVHTGKPDARVGPISIRSYAARHSLKRERGKGRINGEPPMGDPKNQHHAPTQSSAPTLTLQAHTPDHTANELTQHSL